MEKCKDYRDRIIASLTDWQQRLGRYSECGNCERDFLGQVIKAIREIPLEPEEETKVRL